VRALGEEIDRLRRTAASSQVQPDELPFDHSIPR
jgi:hypothetical protein